ncbi:MAG TPA: hypothetical protein VJ301_11060, partial [Propionibacteriaceae bacterium]|nr:hypothetical protein [Propionibacteriaceae bacterium]
MDEQAQPTPRQPQQDRQGFRRRARHSVFLEESAATRKGALACNDVPYVEASLLSSYRTVIGYLNRVGLAARDPFDCQLRSSWTVDDHRPAVWSHGSVCDVRLGFQHSRTVGERERLPRQVEDQGQGLLAMPGLGPDDDVGVVYVFGLDYRVDQPGVAAA